MCKYLLEGRCSLAGTLANTTPIKVDKSRCDLCSKEVNEITIELALEYLESNYPKSRLRKQLSSLHGSGHEKTSGPGTNLKNILSWFSTEGCDCAKNAQVMDAWGPEVCKENIETIVGWLRIEAKKRGLPFWEIPVRAVINYAIEKSK